MHKFSVNTLPQYQLEMTLTVMTARLLLKPGSVLALAPIAEKFLKFVRCNANADADVEVDIDFDDAVDHSSRPNVSNLSSKENCSFCSDCS